MRRRQLVDIIEQAIWETDTGLSAALLAADRILAAEPEPGLDVRKRHVEPHDCPRSEPSSACDFNRYAARAATPAAPEALREAVQAFVDWQYRMPGARRFTLRNLRAALAGTTGTVEPNSPEAAAYRAFDADQRLSAGTTGTAPDLDRLRHLLAVAIDPSEDVDHEWCDESSDGMHRFDREAFEAVARAYREQGGG